MFSWHDAPNCWNATLSPSVMLWYCLNEEKHCSLPASIWTAHFKNNLTVVCTPKYTVKNESTNAIMKNPNGDRNWICVITGCNFLHYAFIFSFEALSISGSREPLTICIMGEKQQWYAVPCRLYLLDLWFLMKKSFSLSLKVFSFT